MITSCWRHHYVIATQFGWYQSPLFYSLRVLLFIIVGGVISPVSLWRHEPEFIPEVTSKRDPSNPRLIIKLNVIQNWMEPVFWLFYSIKLFLHKIPVIHGQALLTAIFGSVQSHNLSSPCWSKIQILTQNQNFSQISDSKFFWLFGFFLPYSSKVRKNKNSQCYNHWIIWNDLLRSNPGQFQIYLTILITTRTDFGNNSLQRTVESQSPQNIFTKIHLSFIQNFQNCK